MLTRVFSLSEPRGRPRNTRVPNIDDFETSNETDRSDEPLLRRRNFGCGGGGGGGWGTPSTTDDSGNLVSTSSGSSFGHTRKGTNGQKTVDSNYFQALRDVFHFNVRAAGPFQSIHWNSTSSAKKCVNRANFWSFLISHIWYRRSLGWARQCVLHTKRGTVTNRWSRRGKRFTILHQIYSAISVDFSKSFFWLSYISIKLNLY